MSNAQFNIMSDTSCVEFNSQVRSINEEDSNNSFGGVGRNQIYKHSDLSAIVKKVVNNFIESFQF